MPTFDVIYREFKIAHPVGDLPRLELCFDLKTAVEQSEGVYIPDFRWQLHLYSTIAPESGGSSLVGDWGVFESIGPEKLFRKSGPADISFTIPMSSQKIQQLVDIRSQERMPRFGITVRIRYLRFTGERNHYQLDSVGSFNLTAKMYLKGREINNVTFGTDDIIRLLQAIRQYELVRIEIPVRKGVKPTNESLAEVVDILNTAKRDLLEGNYGDVLKSVRDSLENRILERDQEKQEWVLNRSIEKSFLDNVPTKALEEYAELLRRIGKEFQSQLRIINDVYMHKRKTRVHPRPEDAEQILFVTAFLVRYLSQGCLNR